MNEHIKYKNMEQNLDQKLETALKKGIVSFSYTKKNGEWREAIGTRNLDCLELPQDAAPKGTGREIPDTITYWDINPEAWRSCRRDSIIAINHEFTSKGWEDYCKEHSHE